MTTLGRGLAARLHADRRRGGRSQIPPRRAIPPRMTLEARIRSEEVLRRRARLYGRARDRLLRAGPAGAVPAPKRRRRRFQLRANVSFMSHNGTQRMEVHATRRTSATS